MLEDHPHSSSRQKRSTLRYVVPALVALPFLALAAAVVLVVSSRAAIRVGSESLARVTLPTGGGTITRVVVVGGREQQIVPVNLRDRQIWPATKLAPGEHLAIQVTIRRPGWIAWLTGANEQVQLTETTPVARPVSTFITRKTGSPLQVSFRQPVALLGYGNAGAELTPHVLRSPARTVVLDEGAQAGSAQLAVAARAWERPTTTEVTWFPQGAGATVVASPAPGSRITPTTPITLTFSKPVSSVLRGGQPPLLPRGAGVWQTLNSRTIRFEPRGYGYGLGASVQVSLPAGVHLVGGTARGSDPVGQWTVPDGSTLALQELLSQLGYLPVTFTPSNGSSVLAGSVAAEEALAQNPPQGTFSWRYPNTPQRLKALWAPGTYGELTKGAVMAFEEAQGLTTDGIAGPDVWKALVNAAANDQKSTFGYTFVMVSEQQPETIKVWHNGQIVVQGLANTGIPQSPTATGTYAVYEHIPVGTMSGTNPNGTPYHDTGIPWISYFNGGDALHGFIRASYGFPQSLGCVEMPYSEAAQVYPYTPIGTIVNIVS